MATVYVSHDPADRAFVESTVLPPLPSLGFSRWIPSPADDDDAMDGGLHACDVMIVVTSEAAVGSPIVSREVERRLKARQPTVVIHRDRADADQIARGLGALPTIPANETQRGLALQLAPVHGGVDKELPRALTIPWDERVFSRFLQDAMATFDYTRGERLLAALARYAAEDTAPCSTQSARADLGTLRRRRQFLLMDRYATIVLKSGNQDLQVRRQHGQALIEQGKFDEALSVLQRVAAEASPNDKERAEAFGLIGRLFKQRYVNDPQAPSASDSLNRAINAYYSIYSEDPNQFWHGVNTASLLLRARRDGIRVAAMDAEAIATTILRRIDALEAEGSIPVWDLASRVEALIALGWFEVAARALDDYLRHPALDAFEVSSTFRQFDQVLQLGHFVEGKGILDRLWEAVDRLRTGGVTTSAVQDVTVAGEPSDFPENIRVKPAPVGAPSSRTARRPIVILVSDPAWQPSEAGGIRLGTRLGTVITAQATDEAIQGLMNDPVVVSIDESRTVVDVGVDMTLECARGIPFVRVADHYSDNGGSFEEQGRHALIAIIDDGIDVLHQAFTDAAGTSRIAGIWDQRDDTGPPPANFTYGTYHSDEDVRRYVTSGVVEKKLGRNSPHGTHVASIAAGRAVGSVFRGVAPEARLLVVRTRSDGDIGYSNSHLDALGFIEQEATRADCPVVVNVSKGMNAAAHDGKSPLEIGFDRFSDFGTKPGRVVVKSAGNERNTRGHAELSVPPNGAVALTWLRKPQPFGFERIELWWSSADSLSFTLRSPGGHCSMPVGDTTPDVSGRLKGGGWFQMQLAKRDRQNGDSRLLVQIGESSDPRNVGVAQGTWTLEIVALTAVSGTPIHAWIARLGGEPSEFQNDVSPKMTITVPGTAQSVIAVGAVEATIPTFPGPFSSSGPTRDGREKPDLVAPGVCVNAAKAGTLQDARDETGTSMAAPHVAGAVALILSRAAEIGRPWPTANQIAVALRQMTKDYNGRHDSSQGYGVLDVAKVLSAF